MTVRLSTGVVNGLAGTGGGFATLFANGCMEIYTGTQPADADNAVTGTLLGTVTLNGGAFTPGSPTNGLTFAAASGGAVSKSGTWQYTGVAAGVAGWFRLKGNASDAGGLSTAAIRLDGSIAVSGADLNLSNINIVIGAPGTIDTFTFTVPKS